MDSVLQPAIIAVDGSTSMTGISGSEAERTELAYGDSGREASAPLPVVMNWRFAAATKTSLLTMLISAAELDDLM